MRTILLSTALALSLPLYAQAQDTASNPDTDPPLPAPKLIGEFVLPTGLTIQGKGFGGLSDLSYDPKTDQFYAISDDKGDFGPPRFYTLKLDVKKDRFAGLDITSEHDLQRPGGGIFGENGADGEGIAVDPAQQRIFWSSERDEKGVPAIYTADQTGAFATSLPLPEAYIPNKEGTKGARDNLSFEGLDLSADGKTLYVSTENALIQDGPKASFTEQSPSRIMLIDTETRKPTAQYIYMTDEIPAKPLQEGGSADNGISALATLPDGRLVIVERNYSEGIGNNIRFYIADLTDATNVNGEEKVDLSKITPVQKRLWFTLKAGLDGVTVDNIEDIAFGPVVDGAQTMLTTTDNNFNRHQATRFKLFSVKLPKAQN
ncbi:hypothetical protein DL1_20655 [Thioclava dalianensis]|uniref:Phytase-like domain-containing protein n=1 Tax=Thioclava dalianensis TaxID=1185766 RepID=A0A074TDQ1_9RHOB|nr:esterase-like activity of phytase family protein [Thioclava dalianensis]KEP69906.1 hypothetical protein DL1_20655 [Thioclava dalianensis]SFN17152.1 3-phytase [Thioclava dalianensis]